MNDLSNYPNTPGYRRTDTSQAAAIAMLPRVGTLQEAVLNALRDRGPLATFEIAEAIGKSYRSVQPRTSELRAGELIRDSGQRKTDPDTGRDTIVWAAV